VPVIDDGGVVTVPADRHGVLDSVDTERLVAAARARHALVRVLPRIGDFVPTGAPLLRIGRKGTFERDPVGDAGLLRCVRLVPERAAVDDVAFGLRQLVDIAERALSPGTNDPSTAVLCIDQLHDLLRRLLDEPDPDVLHEDATGAVRLIVPRPTWEDHVALAVDELRLWGRDSLQVRVRLTSMVEDLLSAATGPRRAPLLDRTPLWRQPLPVDLRGNGDGRTTRVPSVA
jgi:uncharacterized membrane protein